MIRPANHKKKNKRFLNVKNSFGVYMFCLSWNTARNVYSLHEISHGLATKENTETVGTGWLPSGYLQVVSKKG